MGYGDWFIFMDENYQNMNGVVEKVGMIIERELWL